MPSMTTSLFTTPADCEILTTRIFSFSREKLFRAWTDANILKEWWGPTGFTNTFEEFHPVPGGRWKFVMHGPEKGNYPNEVVFTHVEAPALIAWDRVTQPHFSVVTTFEEEGADQTKLSFRMQFKSKEECDKIRRFAVDKNEENFDKLEVELAKMA